MTDKIKYIKELIAQNKLKDAFNLLEELISNEEEISNKCKDAFLLLKREYHDIQAKALNGIESNQQISIHTNSLANRTLNLLDIIEKDVLIPYPKKSVVSPVDTTSIATFIFIPLMLVVLITVTVIVSYSKFCRNHTTTIYGKVFDIDNNNLPIKNAHVEIIDMIGVFSNTDDSGTFSFEINENENKYLEFQVTHVGYKTQSFKIPIDPNKNGQQKLEKFLLKKVGVP